MFTVAVCDNEIAICDQMKQYLEEFSAEQDCPIDILVFSSGEEIYASLANGSSFDLIFLDIQMYQISGIDVAKAIREHQGDLLTQIVYISAKREYAMELFETHPLNFLVKPVKYEDVSACVQKALTLKTNRGEVFTYSIGNNMYRAPLSNILYFESYARKVRIVRNGGSSEFYGRLSDIASKYGEKGFIQIHKSYVVNLGYIDSVSASTVTMLNGDVLPLSRERRTALSEAFLKLHLEDSE
ncbi:MAG: response regulator transcription factor [Firmicutes bacterium]|nr:response regulator transcription factor [Bacillota bacterium]